MATVTLSAITRTVTATITSLTPSSTARASAQGGVLEGGNPTKYDVKNPIVLFIIQAGVIIIFCRLLHYPLSRLRQPRVIAEVIGGILLGPSVMGRIPGFTNAIFPTASMPALTLAANLGLVLFLFLVGLEVDLRFLVSNWRIALSVGTLGMALPFGLGVAIAYGLYHQFSSEPGTVPISFGVYLLFVGVAMAITAFPVLCRILTELKLLSTPVGVIVLSAGVGNDVVGWILLALCVALVNAGTGVTAVYVLLVAVGWTLFLVFAVRPGFMWVLRRTGSLQNGPTQSVVALTVLMVLLSSFMTSIIGVHPIFGAFLVGLICPHEGGFAIKVTEKIEDLVGVLFLPLYFALSGLSTNLGLLNNGITWAYVIGVISVAFFAKVIGGTLAAKFNGLVWRESFTIGVLMSCKGLVELIVLNIGLQAKILSTRTFTIFVVMALVTTFATTPLTKALYPHWYQMKLNAWKRGEIDWDGNRLHDDCAEPDGASLVKTGSTEITKVLAYLRLDNISGVMAVCSLLALPTPTAPATAVHPTKTPASSFESVPQTPSSRPLQVHGIRLAELTERESSVMRVTEIDEYTARDPIVNTFRTFGHLRNVAIAGALQIVSSTDYASALIERASDLAAGLLLLPWSESGSMNESASPVPSSSSRFSNGIFANFAAKILSDAPCPTAVLIDNGLGGSKPKTPRPTLDRTPTGMSAREHRSDSLTQPLVSAGNHVFLPFFGSDDDVLATRLLLQMARDSAVTATVVRFSLPESTTAMTEEILVSPTKESAPGSPISVVTPKTPTTAVPARASLPPAHYANFFAQMADSLPTGLADRVVFESVECIVGTAVEDVVKRARRECGQRARSAGDLVIMGRNRSLKLPAVEEMDAKVWAESEAGRSLGSVVGGLVKGNVGASFLVVRA